MTTMGLTNHGLKEFGELITKANDLQLGPMRSQISNEIQRRFKRNKGGKHGCKD